MPALLESMLGAAFAFSFCYLSAALFKHKLATGRLRAYILFPNLPSLLQTGVLQSMCRHDLANSKNTYLDTVLNSAITFSSLGRLQYFCAGTTFSMAS
eukprot:scaffold135701_cov14-Tisochrysis_lutea.AAC.1